MNLDQMQTQDVQEIQGIDTSTLFPDITSQLTEMMAPFLFASFALTAVFAILYISSALRRRKVEKAILDMQKMLHEMNERDKERKSRDTPQGMPSHDTETLAKNSPENVDVQSV